MHEKSGLKFWLVEAVQVKTLHLTGNKHSGGCNVLYFGVLFHHVGETSVLLPLEIWAGSLASWVLVWPGLLENSTLSQVKAGWLSPASPGTDLHLPFSWGSCCWLWRTPSATGSRDKLKSEELLPECSVRYLMLVCAPWGMYFHSDSVCAF